MSARITDGYKEKPRDSAGIEMFDCEGVLVMAQQLANLTSMHEDVGSILGLAQWFKDLALL